MSTSWYLIFQEVNMKIKLDHINLTVKNLEESVIWYKQVFGFNLVEKGINMAGKNWGIVNLDDYMICMTEHPLKLNANQNNEESYQKIFHFGIRISDDAIWREKIKALNLKILYGGILKYPHSYSWYIQDPNGHEIEVSYADNKFLQFPLTGSENCC